MAITITSTEAQNNFGKYMRAAQNGDEVIVTRNGKEVVRIVSAARKREFLTDSLLGILHGDVDEKAMRRERIEKHERLG